MNPNPNSSYSKNLPRYRVRYGKGYIMSMPVTKPSAIRIARMSPLYSLERVS